jgi:hypothetical protein
MAIIQSACGASASATAAIVTRNYGEAGAVDRYGPALWPRFRSLG